MQNRIEDSREEGSVRERSVRERGDGDIEGEGEGEYLNDKIRILLFLNTLMHTIIIFI